MIGMFRADNSFCTSVHALREEMGAKKGRDGNAEDSTIQCHLNLQLVLRPRDVILLVRTTPLRSRLGSEPRP